MDRIFICTTGTSVANGVGPYPNFETSADYERAVDERIEALRQDLSPSDWLKRVSAESNSLQAAGLGSDDMVYLLHTETDDGRICAEKVAQLLAQGMGCAVEPRSIEGLQVSDTGRFRRLGIQNLFAAVDSICQRHGGIHAGQSIQLNITGGFKSVVPYLTLYGLLKALPVIYLFERSNQLLTLPPVPLGFDLERLARAHDAIHQLRQAGTMPAEQFLEAIPGLDFSERRWFESLIEQEDGEATLSAFGELLAADLDDQENAKLLLSSGVSRRLERASPSERERMDMILSQLRNPLWRQQHRHAFHGTDLAVFKPGATADRVAAFLEGTRIFVCELFTNHDEYERDLKRRQRKHYDRTDFLPWQGPAVDKTPPATEEAARRALEKRLSELDSELEAAQTLATSEAKARLVAEEQNMQLELQTRKLGEKIGQLEAMKRAMGERISQLEQARPSFQLDFVRMTETSKQESAPGRQGFQQGQVQEMARSWWKGLLSRQSIQE